MCKLRYKELAVGPKILEAAIGSTVGVSASASPGSEGGVGVVSSLIG
jgi:hypothetical protein